VQCRAGHDRKDEYKMEDNPLHPNIDGKIFFNPGTGPVENATLENAEANMVQFIADSPLADELTYERGSYHGDEDGRYCFIVIWKKCEQFCVEVLMPGWALDRVRYMGEPEQNAWDFPRLYVDGSSWLWEFAVFK
jgi:hypothetical protein